MRRIRRGSYKKIAVKNVVSTDLDMYKALVGKFVKKFGPFGYKDLSGWEIWTWQQKVVKTRADAVNASFNDDLDL